ncbi:hypothetical protein HPB51_027310 [Rhipicephalus microplus]|uniref:C2H2-type domain-containing protein n=1 Tax=Rhipicephalus microplus TaxID=6941 RepID=A0A9J6D0E4_RHIMP|nr:hypothetical protein HPB51_027310 [Rhipicephalus microplus]
MPRLGESTLQPENADFGECCYDYAYEADTASGSKRRSFPCDQCPVVATDRVGYERHQRTHTGEKPFACPTRGRRFNQKSNMATHMRRHTGEKPFSCDVCSRQFGFKVALVKHMQEEHTVEPLK